MRIGSFFYLNEAKALLLNGTAPRYCFIPVNLLTYSR